MDRSQSFPSQLDAASFPADRVARSIEDHGQKAAEQAASAKAELRLVTGDLTLAGLDHTAPLEWREALDFATQGLGIDVQRVSGKPPASLIEKARRVVNSGGAAQACIFAPWRVVPSTAFQRGQDSLPAPEAQWVASYLFDFGPACPAAQSPVDLVLMSPCPQVCSSEDPPVGPLPRLSTLAGMVRAAAAEGRKSLAIVVRETARATLATRLLGFDASLNEASLDVEFVSVEEAVVRLQRGGLEWDAVIAMPDLRGVVFAMLQQASGIAGPWPMLWFGRGLRMVTCETLGGAKTAGDLNATALLQSLALVARYTSRQYAAQRFFESWASVRDSGVVTPARTSSAPYVNEIAEAAFIEHAVHCVTRNSRPAPVWKGLASECRARRGSLQSVQLRLVN
ncbi:MAG: hypothetical protein AAGK01_06090 [Pseudomonadota bacterium]